MYCSKCGNKIKDGNMFCTNCGASIIEDEKADSKKENIQNKKKKFNVKVIIIILVVIIALIALGIFNLNNIYNRLEKNDTINFFTKIYKNFN